MNDIKKWLIGRKTIYSILASLYRGEINLGLDILKEIQLLQNFVSYSHNTSLSTGASEVIKEIDENKNNGHENLIADDYQRLFVGPNDTLAPLWKSVYRTKDKLLFGDIELEVREFYSSVGLGVKESEPADYLPLQLSFMSRLCDLAEEDKFKNINENLTKQCDFLKQHLLSWISYWVADVNKNAETRFWASFANLTKGWLESDLDEIERSSIVIKNNFK